MVLKNKSFIVIEVLISIFIIFLSIVTIVGIYKQVVRFDTKSNEYQELYITIKSVVNLLDKTDINKVNNLELNGYNIDIHKQIIMQNRNLIFNQNSYTYTL